MTTKEYAQKYGVAQKTVYRWVAENRLKATKKMVEILDVEDKKIKKKPRYKLPPRYKQKSRT